MICSLLTRVPLAAILVIVGVITAILGAPDASAQSMSREARALIETHVAWLGGWRALDGLQDLVLEGTIAVAGLSGTITVQQRRDGFERVEYDLQIFQGVEVLTGETGWERNPSGQIEEMGQEKILDKRRSLARSYGAHLRGEGCTVTVGEPEVKEDRTWSVLRFTYPDGDLFDILLDSETGESDWSRAVVDGRTRWDHGTETEMIEGLRIARHLEVVEAHAAANQSVVWTKIAVNSGVPDAVFSRPGATTNLAHLSDGAKVTDWMPMELHFDRYIYLQGEINGQATEIVLDSGAGMTVLDRPVAAAAGLEEAGALPAQGTGGTVEAGLVQGVNLKLGELEIGPLTAAVIELGDVAERLNRDLPVILGKELFHAMIVEVDYPGSRIRFHDPEAFRYTGKGHRTDVLAAADGHKNVLMAVEDGGPALFGLDTGQGGALSLFARFTDENDLLEGRTLSEFRGGGVGGTTVSKIGTLRKVTIAGFEMFDVPVAFHRENVGGAFDTDRQAGNLGAGILSRFRVIFDYPNGWLWLEPGPDFDAPFPKDKTGLMFSWRGDALHVEFVAPGSPAAAAGWQEGEQVAALDGEKAGADWYRTWGRWADAAAGETIRLTMVDGKERTITLKEYF